MDATCWPKYYVRVTLVDEYTYIDVRGIHVHEMQAAVSVIFMTRTGHVCMNTAARVRMYT